MSLAIAPGGDYLLRGTSPFVMCADTVWSAFADARPAEWRGYLRKRSSQGFNSLLISVLPIINDRSASAGSRTAFRSLPGRPGRELDPAYLDAAVSLVADAAEAGLTPVLVLLWYDYVAGERGLARSPEQILGSAETSAYLDTVTEAFAPYEPVYVVSGDELFSSHDAGPYPALLSAVKARAPGSLTTLHTTPETTLPAQLAESADLDFYAYQSGHYRDRQELTTELAERYLALPARKPVINLEPCYEGHGWGDKGGGRFCAADVRRAIWRSVFGGASAGFAYGAHGLWQWHRAGDIFNGAGFSGEPFYWETALDFHGAWSAGLAARIVTDHGLYRARPAQDLVQAPLGDVRAIATSDLSTIAVYAPYATSFALAADLSGRQVTAIDLERSRWFRPRVSAAAGAAKVAMPDFIGDAIYLFAASA
jgi:hypothetical protein